MGFLITSNFLKILQPGSDIAFHRMFLCHGNWDIPRHWGLHGFSLTLNLWGSAEPGNYLCFPILVPQYENSLIQWFRNCMKFCFMWNISETYYFGMFDFSHTFSYWCCFSKCNIVKNSYFFRYNHTEKICLPGFWCRQLEQYLLNNLHIIRSFIMLNIEKNPKISKLCRIEFPSTEVWRPIESIVVSYIIILHVETSFELRKNN